LYRIIFGFYKGYLGHVLLQDGKVGWINYRHIGRYVWRGLEDGKGVIFMFEGIRL